MKQKPEKYVLVVEDEDNWQGLICELLEQVASERGWIIRTVIVSSFAEAMTQINTVAFDCVTVDNQLRDGANAKRLIEYISVLGRKTPVIVVSGAVNPGEARDLLKDDGIEEFFWKDTFRHEQFRSVVTSLLLSRYVLEPLKAAWSEAGRSLDSSQGFASAAVKVLDLLSEHLGTDYKQIRSYQDRFIAFSLDSTAIFRGIAQLDRLPIVFCRVRNFTDREIDQLRAFLSGEEMAVAFSKVALLVVLAEVAGLQEARRLLDKLNRVYAFDTMLVELGTLEGIVIEESPSDALRQFILRLIDLRSVSPFITTGPTTDPVFFGREQELREVSEHLANTSFAVMGGRRIGKSSLLNRLHRIVLPGVGFCTVYHDCSTTPTCDTFLNAAIRDWRPEPPLDAPATFGRLFQSPPDGKPLALILDEVDKLVSDDRANNWRLFNTLRGLVNSGRTQVVLCGERTLRDALRDSTSPFFNIANEILIGPLNFRAVEELVTRPMKQLEIELVEEKAIVDRIYTFTSGHPNVVQRLCRRLIELLNEQGTRRITLDDVDAVIGDPGFKREDFLSTYWEAATPLEKIISLLMSEDENARTLLATRHALAERCNLHPKAREVDDALQRLVDLRAILKRSPTGYRFAVEAFPRVVAGTMTLDDMLEILTEEYQDQGE